MYFLTVNNINIIYSDKEKTYISDIVRTIKNNFDFFKRYQNKTLSFVPIAAENVYYIDNFDFFFAKTVRSLIDDEEMKDFFKNVNLKNYSIIEYVYRTIFGTNLSPLLQGTSKQVIEIIICLAAFKDEEIDFVSLINHLKNRKSIKSLVFKYILKNQYTFNSYVTGTIDPELNKYSLEKYFNGFIANELFKKPSTKNQPVITKDELFSLFTEFLTYVNAPAEWQDTFTVLKNKNWISFDNNSDSKIQITQTGTIADFYDLVFEFINLLIKDNPPKMFSVAEIPGLFYEKLATEFLTQKGFDKNELFQIAKARKYHRMHQFIKDYSKYHHYLYGGEDLYKELLTASANLNQKIIMYAMTGDFSDISSLEENFEYQKSRLIKLFKDGKVLYTKDSIYPISLEIAEQIYAKYIESPEILKYMSFVVNEFDEFDLSSLIYFLDLPENYERGPGR